MIDNISKLFKLYGNPVIVAQAGVIVFFNGAAEKLIPDIKKMKLEDIFSEQLLTCNDMDVVGAITQNGINMTVSISELEGYRIFSVLSSDNGELNESGMFLREVDGAFRNSLSVLKMAADRLTNYIENMDDGRLERYSAMVQHSYYSMLRTSNNISELCDNQSDYKELSNSFINMVDLCRNIIDSTAHFVPERGVELRFETNTDTILLFADKEKLQVMILNLLSNSLKYTPAGGVITLSLALADERVIITVRDTGCGIPEDVMFTVWNRYTIQKERTDHVAGIGMGLAIVQRIARLHGGSAVLESRIGKGTTVTVVLPKKTPEDISVKESFTEYERSGMNSLLTEFSDVVSYETYSHRYMD